MKMKFLLSLMTMLAAALLASGCSQQSASQQMTGQQMVGQQVAQAAPPTAEEETVETIVETVVDCSKCPPKRKPVTPPPAKKKCWHGRNSKGQCNPRPGGSKPSTRPVCPKVDCSAQTARLQQQIRRLQEQLRNRNRNRQSGQAQQAKRCWHGRNSKGQCNPRPGMNRSSNRRAQPPRRSQPPRQQQQKRCWHGRNAKGQCNPDPRMRKPTTPQTTRPNKPTTPAPSIPPVKAKGNYKGPVTIDSGVMMPYQQ